MTEKGKIENAFVLGSYSHTYLMVNFLQKG